MSVLYTVVSAPLVASFDESSQLRSRLEKGTEDEKIRAMRQIVLSTITGEHMPHLLMDIIRFVLPSKNKQLKKLLHSYWEIVPKLDDQGKLRQEMILVVNAIRNDLQHPNEYIRGGTLRFLTKFREPELLDPLVPTIRQCLEHRHAYVRKNAAFCVLGIAQFDATKHLIPDAAELLYAFLVNESDATCRHNAFVALARLDRASAYAYFHSQYSNIASSDEMLQLALIDFAANDALSHPELTDGYIQILQGWLSEARPSSGSGVASSAVAYEVATALSKLTNDHAVLSEVAATYIDIAVKESDNNVKVTVLNRVSNIVEDDSLSHLVMDVLLVLSTQDIAVRRTALNLTLQLVSGRTVDQVLRLLKKELANSFGQKYDTADAYRSAIIDSIHQLARRFKDSAGSVVTLLLEFLGELNTTSALEVIKFAKEVVQFQPENRSMVVRQLSKAVHFIRSSRAYLSALWVLGEYAHTSDEILKAWSTIKEALGPVPFDPASAQDGGEKLTERQSTKPRILADGTYATESPLEVAAAAAAAAERSDSHYLRKLLLDGDYFLCGALAATLTKLGIRYSRTKSVSVVEANKIKAEGLLIMSSLLRTQATKINDDSFDRIYGCINLLIQGSEDAQFEFLAKPHDAFTKLEESKADPVVGASKPDVKVKAVQIEQPIKFRLFSKLDNNIQRRDTQSYKTSSPKILSNSNQSQLKQVTQLTGYSDPVYVEALMAVSQFDIILDVMVFNQTNETLQNLKVEFFTTGELKVIDSLASVNLAPLSFHTCRVVIRVSSVDSATIFGDIAYDGKHKLNTILLNDIRLNIIDYIRPETCTDSEFRAQWVKFEWENKVPVQNTSAKSLSKYLELFLKRTNMSCLTEGAGEEGSNFLSANLYARSCFGEVVLANLSAELTSENVVSGHVRVRAKQKGAAVSVGDCVVAI